MDHIGSEDFGETVKANQFTTQTPGTPSALYTVAYVYSAFLRF